MKRTPVKKPREKKKLKRLLQAEAITTEASGS
jgi:hypothetical protein